MRSRSKAWVKAGSWQDSLTGRLSSGRSLVLNRDFFSVRKRVALLAHLYRAMAIES